jgi:hypothetical protein
VNGTVGQVSLKIVNKKTFRAKFKVPEARKQNYTVSKFLRNLKSCQNPKPRLKSSQNPKPP